MLRVLISFCLLFVALESAAAAEDLNPPFGFRWNDPMSRVEAVLKGAKAAVVKREKKESREVWTVQGLVHPGLKRTLFTFKGGALFGVELQYEYPDWSIERYNERMGEIRRYFDAKYGTGKLVSRTRDTDSDVIQTTFGSHIGFAAEINLRIHQDEGHRLCRIDVPPIQLHSRRPIFHLGHVEHGELNRFPDLLRGQTDAVRRVHCLDHVLRQLANA